MTVYVRTKPIFAFGRVACPDLAHEEWSVVTPNEPFSATLAVCSPVNKALSTDVVGSAA